MHHISITNSCTIIQYIVHRQVVRNIINKNTSLTVFFETICKDISINVNPVAENLVGLMITGQN